jgi:hypothetical protein
MARGDNLEWIRLEDFRPGIMDRTFYQGGTVAPFPQGAAQSTNTYRCIAFPEGGLGPLPRRATEYTRASPQTIGNVPAGKFWITGLLIQGPMAGSAGGGIDPSQAIIGLEWINDTPARRALIDRVRINEAAAPINNIATTTDAVDFVNIRRPAFIYPYRANATSALDPGVPGAVVTWYSGQGATTRWWFMFPDPGSPTSLTPEHISTTKDVEPSVTHQGRSIACEGTTYESGSASYFFVTNELVFYTNSNLTTIQNATAAVFGQENASGYTAFCSMSAGELFCLKRQGAFVIREDINDPTVIRLPGVTGGGGTTQLPVATPIGAVYGTIDNGVWAWAGGEESQLISANLETDFLTGMTDQSQFNGDHLGRFEVFGEWILCANNWLYNYRQQSWWRIDDPADVEILHWSAGIQTAGIFGTPVTFVDETTPYMYFYDQDSPAHDYSWQSQPLPATIHTDVQVRQIVLVAEGRSGDTVTVTVTGLSGQTASAVFTLDDTSRFQVKRQSISVTGGHLVVRIEADGDGSAAPIVRGVHLGHYVEHSLPNQ